MSLPLPGAPVDVAIANDYELVVAGLAAVLAPHADRVRVVDLIVDHDPDDATVEERNGDTVDVVLFDTYGRTDLGLPTVRELIDDPGAHHVVVYSWERRHALIDRALAEGASGWVSKALPAPDLVDAIERVARGEVVVATPARATPIDTARDWPGRRLGLTERESEVLVMLAAGRRNREIAEELVIGAETVKTHLRNVYRTLGVENRVQAAALALANPEFVARPATPLWRQTAG